LGLFDCPFFGCRRGSFRRNFCRSSARFLKKKHWLSSRTSKKSRSKAILPNDLPRRSDRPPALPHGSSIIRSKGWIGFKRLGHPVDLEFFLQTIWALERHSKVWHFSLGCAREWLLK